MPKAPDWLLQMANKAPGMVDDSPQFRQAEQDKQRANLASASVDALKQVQQKTMQSQIGAAQAGMQAIRDGQQQIQAITPTETPKLQTPIFQTPETSNVPPPSEFESNPQPLPPPDMSTPPVNSGNPNDMNSMQGEDLLTTVNQISEASGLPPQVVAMMSLLGQDISELENRGEATYDDVPPPTPTQPQMPNFGIGASPPGVQPPTPPVQPPTPAFLPPTPSPLSQPPLV